MGAVLSTGRAVASRAGSNLRRFGSELMQGEHGFYRGFDEILTPEAQNRVRQRRRRQNQNTRNTRDSQLQPPGLRCLSLRSRPHCISNSIKK